MVQLPSNIEVEETVDGFRYKLPARDAAAGARGVLLFGAIFGGFALVWIVMALFITQAAGEAGFFKVCFPLFGLPFLLVGGAIFLHGAKLAWARTVIKVNATTLTVTDGWAFMRKTRKREISAIGQLVVSSHQRTQTSGGCAIVANCENAPALRFANGYSQTILVPIAESLLKRTDIQGSVARAGGETTPGVIISTAGIPHVPEQRPTDVLLSSADGAMGGVILLIVALFWNGIVGTIATVWYMSEGFNFWLLLIVCIFGGVGMLILFGAIHQMLAASRMKPPAVKLSTSPVLIGETVQAHFSQVPKRGVRINRVTVKVICRESATYTHGTNTTTVTHDVSSEEFVLEENKHASPLQPLEGEFLVAIPDDAMHSLSATRNSIMWIIETHTDIAGWPDYRHSVKFDVAAQRVQMPFHGSATGG